MLLILVGGEREGDALPEEQLPDGYQKIVIRGWATSEAEQVFAGVHSSYFLGQNAARRAGRLYFKWRRLKEDFDRRNATGRERLKV